MDLELSFTTQEDVRNLIEQLIQYFWPAIKGQITIPFPSMTYHEAMIQYGSDKPDTRYDMRVGFSCRFIVFLFVWVFFDPLENFSFIRRGHHYQQRFPNFALYSALMAIGQ